MPTNTLPAQNTIVYSDLDDSLNTNPVTGDVLMVFGFNSVVQSIMNLMQLGHYEKPFHSEIGSGIEQLLFELPSPAVCQLLSQEIRNTIANFEPRASVQNVYVEIDPQSGGYSVTIVFTVVGIPQQITISLFLQRIR